MIGLNGIPDISNDAGLNALISKAIAARLGVLWYGLPNGLNGIAFSYNPRSGNLKRDDRFE